MYWQRVVSSIILSSDFYILPWRSSSDRDSLRAGQRELSGVFRVGRNSSFHSNDYFLFRRLLRIILFDHSFVRCELHCTEDIILLLSMANSKRLRELLDVRILFLINNSQKKKKRKKNDEVEGRSSIRLCSYPSISILPLNFSPLVLGYLVASDTYLFL